MDDYQLPEYIVVELHEERKRQNAKFPEQHYRLGNGDVNPGLMLAILMEEVGEVAKAQLEDGPESQREELVQVAAVCVAWIEGIDAMLAKGKADG